MLLRVITSEGKNKTGLLFTILALQGLSDTHVDSLVNRSNLFNPSLTFNKLQPLQNRLEIKSSQKKKKSSGKGKKPSTLFSWFLFS